jgi:hypothetical protein
LNQTKQFIMFELAQLKDNTTEKYHFLLKMLGNLEKF